MPSYQTILKYQTKTRPLADVCPLPPRDPTDHHGTQPSPLTFCNPLYQSIILRGTLHLETHWPRRPGNQAGGLHSPSCPQLQIPGIIPSPVAKHFQGPVLPL